MSPDTPLSRVAGWLAGTVLAAWFVVYNVMRIGGDDPASAALPALLIGGLAGLALFAVGLLVLRRLHSAGRVVHGTPEGRPVDRTQVVRLLGPPVVALGAAALVAVAVAVGMGVDYLGIEEGRPRSTLLLIAWNVVFGVWLADEARRLAVARSAVQRVPAPVPAGARGGPRSGEDMAPGLSPNLNYEDSIWFACLLTAVLAAVAWSRDVLPTAQVVLIVVSGVAAAVINAAVWRLRGGGGVPLGIVIAVVVTAACLVLPTL